MSIPKISIVIPAYNEEKRIKATLKSIFEQDFPLNKFEVLLIDNNSTDKTPMIVKKYFPQVKIIKETKQGTVFARIRGVEEAKGEIIAMTDADAIVPPSWLSKIVKTYKDPQVVAVGGTTNFDYKNNWIRLCQFCINNFNLAFKTFPGHNLSFKKKSYFKCGGFSPKVNLCEDFYLAIKIKNCGKVIILKDNPVTVSARRFFSGFLTYALKYIINIFAILTFDKPIFFKFEEVREETLTSIAWLKEKIKY